MCVRACIICSDSRPLALLDDLSPIEHRQLGGLVRVGGQVVAAHPLRRIVMTRIPMAVQCVRTFAPQHVSGFLFVFLV